MTDHENTQHRPSTSETNQAYESGWIAAARKRGARFLELTKGSLHTARMIYRHGPRFLLIKKKGSQQPLKK